MLLLYSCVYDASLADDVLTLITFCQILISHHMSHHRTLEPTIALLDIKSGEGSSTHGHGDGGGEGDDDGDGRASEIYSAGHRFLLCSSSMDMMEE